MPVLGYHFPLMSAPGIDVDVLPRLTDVGVVGLKDSSGDPARLVRTLETFAGDLYVGSPWLLSAAGPLGATGAILAVANVEPELSIAAFAGDVAAQRQLAATAQRATGPGAVKAVLAERTGRSARTRDRLRPAGPRDPVRGWRCRSPGRGGRGRRSRTASARPGCAGSGRGRRAGRRCSTDVS